MSNIVKEGSTESSYQELLTFIFLGLADVHTLTFSFLLPFSVSVCEILLSQDSHMDGKSMLAVSRETQFLTTWTSPQSFLSVLPTWQLPSARASDPRQHKAEKQREDVGTWGGTLVVWA